MNDVSKTLYIPLWGKAYVSRRGIILEDRKAEEIWAEAGFPLRGKAASKWLAFYMGMRAAVFDRWLSDAMEQKPSATVLHLGCGLDSRVIRVGNGTHRWYDVDFPEVIGLRKRHYSENGQYRMLGADLRAEEWLEEIEGEEAIVVMEGISMYLSAEELEKLLCRLTARFGSCRILMDVYTEFAARMSRYRNPVNEVGVTCVYGLDDPMKLTGRTGLQFRKEHRMTPEDLIALLGKGERLIFRKVYAGKISDRLYRLYEFST